LPAHKFPICEQVRLILIHYRSVIMKQKDAIKLAIECLRKEYQALAVHANLCTTP